ncbi:MAG TPA: ferrous iron transport protein B [Longimicrobiales bacterium]|nr:ferrous iron transport protein B [Longimicrobiales bacterium]
MKFPRIALVGAPNVGKSALFNRLTGAYVTVSNYPGTSVEVSRGTLRLEGWTVEVIDTPGLYSLLASTEEERVARGVVLDGESDVLVHVVDAKALPRMLPLTLQLVEAQKPLILAVNMMDEAERLGLGIDLELLARRLSIPVVPIVAIRGRGVEALIAEMRRALGGQVPALPVYPNGVGAAIGAMRSELHGHYPVDPTVFASLYLQNDPEITERVAGAEPDGGVRAREAVVRALAAMRAPAGYRVAIERQRMSDDLLAGVVARPPVRGRELADRLGHAVAAPWPGIPILLLVLYLGLYKFVGQFGAGTLVDGIETWFEQTLNPVLESWFAAVPWTAMRALFVGDYGVLTLGLRYAIALILPIVGTFFLFFAVLEDSGYFPRLALLVDRLFKRIGLSGRAVIPMVLGFACDTMATMVTRTLETKRERVLATILLALAIPCSAQLGVILAILSGNPLALGVWAASVFAVFLLVGFVTAKLLPGAAPRFHMELPPLRLPRIGNVLTKTYTRMHWYFLEVLPLFLIASVLLWVGDLTGLFDVAVRALSPVVGLLGLPSDAAGVFLFGFFRRDYGAAGLFDLSQAGALDPVQLTVAAVTLTLFVPCIAQFLMMIRERGLSFALGVLAFITPFAFGAGFLLNYVLRGLGW